MALAVALAMTTPRFHGLNDANLVSEDQTRRGQTGNAIQSACRLFARRNAG